MANDKKRAAKPIAGISVYDAIGTMRTEIDEFLAFWQKRRQEDPENYPLMLPIQAEWIESVRGVAGNEGSWGGCMSVFEGSRSASIVTWHSKLNRTRTLHAFTQARGWSFCGAVGWSQTGSDVDKDAKRCERCERRLGGAHDD